MDDRRNEDSVPPAGPPPARQPLSQTRLRVEVPWINRNPTPCSGRHPSSECAEPPQAQVSGSVLALRPSPGEKPRHRRPSASRSRRRQQAQT